MANIKQDEWIDLPGSNIVGAAWDSKGKFMLIRFKNGWQYQVACPIETFEGLVNAGGSRSFYDREIRDVYRVSRLK